jgi:hypothetical protein
MRGLFTEGLHVHSSALSAASHIVLSQHSEGRTTIHEEKMRVEDVPD